MATSKLRRLLSLNRSFDCADVEVGEPAPFYKAVTRNSAPRRRDLAAILEIDGAGAAVQIQSRTSTATRRRVRRQVGPEDVGTANWNPASENVTTLDSMPSVASGKTLGNYRSVMEGGGFRKARRVFSSRAVAREQ